MSDEAALLAAITAHADEDTPRLAYADWLDENEAPVQAEFIRLQCRLASCSPADPDYPDLIERHAEVVAQFGPLAKLTAPELPPGFHGGGEIASFHRGFLSTACGSWRADRRTPTPEDVDQFAAGLQQLIATTTVREIHLNDLTPDQVYRVLTAPGAEALTSVFVVQNFALDYGTDTGDELIRAIAVSKAAPNLDQLGLFFGPGHPTTSGIARLALAQFDRLSRLSLWLQTGPTCDLAPLTGAKWFRALRRVYFSDAAPRGSALVPALAQLPRLESLDLLQQSARARKALGTARGFPALTRLELQGRAPFGDAVQMARGRFPSLTELVVRGEGDANAAVQRFCGAKWWSQIRVLELAGGWITDETIKMFAHSEVAPTLRTLRLHQRSFGAAGLAVLANGARFPNLTTLDLDLSHTATCRSTVAVAFARRLSLLRLRHLSLSGYPLGDAGAKALAANPNLAAVTRLALRSCGIGERGFTALARSPHLQQLVELDIGNNNLKRVSALLDPARLPRLSALGLHDNSLTPSARDKLHRARGWLA